MRNVLSPAVVLSLLCSVSAARALDATSADDICTPATDPCVISEAVHMHARTLLDFGLRRVELTPEGKLDFGPYGGELRCAQLEAATGSVIDVSGPSDGALEGGFLKIEARRACAIGAPTVACLENEDCNLGSCTARFCSASDTRRCTSDANCNVGPCVNVGTSSRCAFLPSLGCTTSSDCSLGTCSADTFCSEVGDGKRSCSTSTDCNLGSCTVGEGSITIGSSIEGRGNFPALLEFSAADSISLSGPVNVTSSWKQGDGGELALKATNGDVTVTGRVRANGGMAGGVVEIEAGGDAVLAGRIDMDGGDFDGGYVDVRVGGDVRIEESIRASSRSGAGWGGDVSIWADGGIEIAPGPSTRRIRIRTNGHGNAFGDAGNGGWQDYFSELGDVTVHEDVELISNGGRPGGEGGDVGMDANGHVQMNGTVVARGRGASSEGGRATFFSSGSIELGPTSEVDVDSSFDGGFIRVDADGDIVLAGTMHADAPSNGQGGSIDVGGNGDLAVTGSFRVSGDESSSIRLENCRIDLLAGADIVNAANGGLNEIVARESMRLDPGSEVLARQGANRLVYRTEAKPPVTGGLIDTAAVLQLQSTLVGCPVCGNAEIDQDETCDDGNVMDGDGCSSSCFIEMTP